MVSAKFWRGKFSRPATGYECIAHAQTFDRSVGLLRVLAPFCVRGGGGFVFFWLHQFSRGVGD